MTIFVISLVVSFIVLACVIAAMAIGVINGRQAIKGSCGGVWASGSLGSNGGPASDGSCPYCGSDGTECLDTDAKT